MEFEAAFALPLSNSMFQGFGFILSYVCNRNLDMRKNTPAPER